MISLNQTYSPQVLNNCISVLVAARYSGYSSQYLRRLLRNGKFGGIKIGQLWLVDKGALDLCLERVETTADRRFGRKHNQLHCSIFPLSSYKASNIGKLFPFALWSKFW